MVVEDEYELLPHEEIQKLRNELDKLKKNPLGSTPEAHDLQASVIDLTKAINSLTTLLTDTNDSLTEEFSRTSISEQFAQVSAQNEQIAQGILAVAQMLQKMSEPKPEPKPEPVVKETPPQNPSYDPRMIPPSQEPQPGMQFSNQYPSQAPPNQQFQPQSNFQNESSMNPSMQSMPDSFSQSSSFPPPSALDLPPAPVRKKSSSLMGMFK